MDSLYEVYVYASDGKTNSLRSSVITILAAPEELSLPEPTISVNPVHLNQTYLKGEKIDIKCSVESSESLNVDLEVGNLI
ncbi:unnamed protein product, partial [Anisakis simplex]|uniref:Ig-like domain-containing protein n=1 Tax=Anisakis simplex TaxID=6269 RepID=A0A0M3JP48_ANISI